MTHTPVPISGAAVVGAAPIDGGFLVASASRSGVILSRLGVGLAVLGRRLVATNATEPVFVSDDRGGGRLVYRSSAGAGVFVMRFGPNGATLDPPALTTPAVGGGIEAAAAIGRNGERTLVLLAGPQPQLEPQRYVMARGTQVQLSFVDVTRSGAANGAVARLSRDSGITHHTARVVTQGDSVVLAWTTTGHPSRVNLARIVP